MRGLSQLASACQPVLGAGLAVFEDQLEDIYDSHDDGQSYQQQPTDRKNFQNAAA